MSAVVLAAGRTVDLAAVPGHGQGRGRLDAQVHGRDLVADRHPVRRGHGVGGLRGHLAGQVRAGHLRAGQDPFAERAGVCGAGGDAGPHRAALAQVPGQRPGAGDGDAGDALGAQLVVQAPLRPPVRGQPGRLADHVPADPDPPRFGVLVVDPGVADVRCGHRHDLAGVGRVGQRLLVAGHAGVEDHLAERLAVRAEPGPAERGAVLQDQDRRRARPACRRHQASFPSRTVGVPRRNVATTRPGSSIPANGLFRLREACARGSTVSRAAAS